MKSVVRRLCLRAAAAAALVATASPVAAQIQFETIHEFKQGPGAVFGRLAQAADGNLYGVARDGGTYGGGIVFVIRRSAGNWLPAVPLHEFRASEGTAPVGGLVQSSPGVLLGTTTKGGPLGGGTIFQITIFGAFRLLASLHPAVHGSAPISELTRGLDLNFYGTTTAGGPRGFGTVFRMTPAGALTVLHAFGGRSVGDGEVPSGALAVGIDGQMWGTTQFGGTGGVGTVFRVTLGGAYAVLQSFPSSGFNFPAGRLTLAPDGALYGTSKIANPSSVPSVVPRRSAVFRVTPDGVIHSFMVFQETSTFPEHGLTLGLDGWLYGSIDGFSVYRAQPGTGLSEGVVPPFGGYPVGAGGYGAFILADDGRFYRGTPSGGIGGYGTVHSFSPSGDVRILHSFESAPFYPTSTFLLAGFGFGPMFSTTLGGGRNNTGTVFALHPGRAVETVAEQTLTDGNLFGDLVEDRGGGFLMAPTTRRIMQLTDRTLTTLFPDAPSGSPLAATNGTLYVPSTQSGHVITSSGGQIHLFTGPDGMYPNGLIEFGGAIYGTTRFGGLHDRGTVFRLAFDGTLTTLHHFSGPDGQWPVATLTAVDNAEFSGLVGTTMAGGNTSASPDGNGTVFTIGFDGAGFHTLHAFGPGEGSNPIARLADGGNVFYGTTPVGGRGYGTVFAARADGSFTTLHSFTAGDGAHPIGGVTIGFTDGALYGTTMLGGTGNAGTIFTIRLF